MKMGLEVLMQKHNKIYSCNSSLIGCTSFFNKTLGGYGDGGAIFNNEKIANICRQIRLMVKLIKISNL